MKIVAYLGIPGSYSYLAARRQFAGTGFEFVGASSFRAIFTGIENGNFDYGMIPVENSLAGSVYDNYDLLHQHDVAVVGEQYLKIDLHLLGTKSSMQPATRLEHISKVVSHYKALEQCDRFLANHPWIKSEIHSDTAGAAKFVADQKDPFLAAIASRETAEIYGLDILAENVQDNEFNYTRFLVIAKEPEAAEAPNKCSIIFTVSHKPGSLFAALQALAEGKMNLDKIESRPIAGKPFEYIFYVDFDWNGSSLADVQSILEKFKKSTNSLKVLGFYPGGVIPQTA
ncbi:MAG: prephenate dehydratase [Patescibacteria group bacterium]|nr:prephenate dehydratase [Patescibacteria group bacterium]